MIEEPDNKRDKVIVTYNLDVMLSPEPWTWGYRGVGRGGAVYPPKGFHPM